MQAQRILNNRYELLAKIGDGGMAIVYKARDIILNRTVAVKILRESYASDPSFLARFRREAQAAASLNHPNIVSVFDVGQEGSLNYIVMEYIEGSNLKELINQEAPLPTQQAIVIASEICDAIGYAHSKGLIHRDIKPQNILLTPDGKIKVTDFGIAKGFGDQNLTQTGITLGTVHYFSPEQAKGLPVQPQSDIYSIGVVLYEMMTARIPFDSDNPVALAVKHIEEVPPPPRRFNASIPPALEGIILKALSKDPAQRYPSAAAMAKALRNLESQSEMGTMAVQPTPVVRPPANQYGNGEVYSQPVQRAPYPQQSPTAYNPNAGQVSRPVQNQGYFGSPTDYHDQQVEANLQRASRSNAVRPAAYTYDNNQAYRRGQTPPPYATETDDFEERRSSGPGLGAWLIGILAFVALIALVIVGIIIVPPLLTNQATPLPATAAPVTATLAPVVEVSVPNVVNKAETEARKALTDAKLDVGNETQQFDPKVTPGNVISQDPAANAKVNSGTKINLVVSKGQDLVNLPDYVNRDGNAAKNALSQLGFQVQVISQPDPKIQSGAVIKTDPVGGTDKNYARGSIIKLYVSTGQPTATPAPQSTATPAPQPTATPAPAAQPTATSIPAPQPTATSVVIKVNVPDVFNQTQNQATQTLENAGFKVDTRLWTIDDVKKYYPNDQNAQNYFNNAQPGTVVGMQPGPTIRNGDNTPSGDQQPKGSTITIGVKKS